MNSLKGKIKCPRCFAYMPVAREQQVCEDCNLQFKPLKTGSSRLGKYRITSIEDHKVLPSKVGFSHESFLHPELATLRKRYSLDKVIQPYRSRGEFAQQLALREWVSSMWTAGQPSVKGVKWIDSIKAADLLEHTRKTGSQYFCTFKAIATCQIFASMGWTARLVNNSGGKNRFAGGRGGHMINDFWSNEHAKWVFSDSLFNIIAVKDDVPLSSYEIRKEFFRNRGKDVSFEWGVERIPLPRDPHFQNHASGFEWFVVYTHNNFLDYPPGDHIFPLLMPRDRHNQRDKWAKDNGLGNTYVSRGIVQDCPDASIIDAPINHTEILPYLENNQLKVSAHSHTYAMKKLQYRNKGSNWKTYAGPVEIPAAKRKTELEFSSLNQLDVRGPVSRLVMEKTR